jgi:hypothetical protein
LVVNASLVHFIDHVFSVGVESRREDSVHGSLSVSCNASGLLNKLPNGFVTRSGLLQSIQEVLVELPLGVGIQLFVLVQNRSLGTHLVCSVYTVLSALSISRP